MSVAPEITFRTARRILGDPDALLRAVGAMMVSGSQRAFEDQAYDGKPWPAAYPSMPAPKVRLANLVGSLLEGQNPPSRVLDDRPAGIWSHELAKSIDARILSSGEHGGLIEVGSWLPYADRFQSGGQSSRPVTPEVRQGLMRWLDRLDPPDVRKERRAVRARREKVRGLAAERAETKGDRSPAAKKRRANIDAKREKIQAEIREKRGGLVGAPSNPIRTRVGFLFGVDELATNSVGRQFVGKPAQIERDIADAIEAHLARGD